MSRRGRHCVSSVTLSVVLIVAFAACGGSLDTGTSGAANILAPQPNVLYQSSLKAPLLAWEDNQHATAAADGYHIKAGYIEWAPIKDLSDVTISVDAKQISGGDQAIYGVTFRALYQNHYEFDITSSGAWYLSSDDDNTMTTLVDLTSNSAIRTGLNVSNTLKVEAQGSYFTFYVNGQKVGQFDDTAHPTGLVGLVGDDNAEVVYSNLKIVTAPPLTAPPPTMTAPPFTPAPGSGV